MAVSEQSGEKGATADAVAPLPVLKLCPRDARFAVVVEGRPARAGHIPFQIAIPQELHRRLRFESLGSINQVMVALVRQAVSWLDADGLTLHAEAHPGPEPRSLAAARVIPDGLTDAGRRDHERGLDDLWPNARLSTRPRVDDRVVVQVERQTRADAQLTQIALPPGLHRRLLHNGIGAVSQLVISLARYALRRLDDEALTLEVQPTAKRSLAASNQAAAGEGEGDAASEAESAPSVTVAQLMAELSKLPPEAFVVFEEQADCWWDFHEIALVHLDPGNPYDGFSDDSKQPKTPIVVLRGKTSVIYEPPEGDSEFVDI